MTTRYSPLQILYADNHLLAINKPVGLATMGLAADETSLLTLAKAYIKQTYDKPGNVYLGVVSRLDAMVSGVVLLARTSKAAARLSAQFAGRDVLKVYQAIVAGQPQPPAGTLTDYLAKNEAAHRVEVVGRQHPEAKLAELSYQRTATIGRDALLEIELHTGRKHQIRVQFAARGHAILGDRKYGSQRPFPAGIALHSAQLELLHPTTREPMVLRAPLPAVWREFGVK